MFCPLVIFCSVEWQLFLFQLASQKGVKTLRTILLSFINCIERLLHITPDLLLVRQRCVIRARRYFNRFRGKPVRFLEIGVQSGGTINLWKHYFGNQLDYYGTDINFLCKEMFDSMANVTITIGDQANSSFWAEFLADQDPFDIVVDDGGHSMKQQM